MKTREGPFQAAEGAAKALGRPQRNPLLAATLAAQASGLAHSGFMSQLQGPRT